MPGVLFKIPVTQWVRQTIQKMELCGKQDIGSWSKYWLEIYRELGGVSDESGK